MNRRAVTMIELMVAVTLCGLAFFATFRAFHLIFGTGSSHGAGAMARRSGAQQDAKGGLRRLDYRLSEARQILEPPPGRSGNALVFLDLTNQRVRLRRDEARGALISERWVQGDWRVENDPPAVTAPGGETVQAGWPIILPECVSAQFTSLSPECVTVQVSTRSEGQVEAFLTVIEVNNALIQ